MVLAMPGMPGAFISNLLNLADDSLRMDKLTSWMRDSMLRPLPQSIDQQESYQTFTSSPTFFQVMSSPPSACQMDLLLNDIEIRLRTTNAAIDEPRSDEDYTNYWRDMCVHGSVYLNLQPSARPPYDTLGNINALHAYALDLGINIRFIMLTVESIDRLRRFYMRGRGDGSAVDAPFRLYCADYAKSLLPCRHHPATQELKLDALLSGDIDPIFYRMEELVTGAMRDPDGIKTRLASYLELRMPGPA